PINEQRTSDHIPARDKPPKPAVQADVTVVAHAKQAIGRDYQLAVFEMLAHLDGPVGRGVQRRAAGKIFTIFFVRALPKNIRLRQRFAIPVNYAVFQMDPVARQSHDSLYHIHSRFFGVKKYDDVATLDLAKRQDGANRGGPGQRGKAI